MNAAIFTFRNMQQMYAGEAKKLLTGQVQFSQGHAYGAPGHICIVSCANVCCRVFKHLS